MANNDTIMAHLATFTLSMANSSLIIRAIMARTLELRPFGAQRLEALLAFRQGGDLLLGWLPAPFLQGHTGP